MAQYFEAHPDNPQPRLLKQAALLLQKGGIVAVPTDSSYALVFHLDDKDAVDRLRRIRQVDEKHHLTLLCRDLSELANYARVDNRQYRLLKLGTPGPYTFILEATKEVPRRVSHPSRKTIGLRVPVRKGLHIDLLATRIDGGDYEARPLARQRLKRTNADGRPGQSGRQSLGEGQAHAQAGERPRAHGHADALEVAEAEARLSHRLSRHARQALLMAAHHRLGDRRQHPLTVEDGDGAGGQAGVYAEDAHASTYGIFHKQQKSSAP